MQKATWSRVIAKKGPPARSSHTINCVNEKLYVFGGEGMVARETLENNLYALDLSTNSWSSKKATIPARLGHASTVVGDKLYIHGGRLTDKSELNDLWAYDTTNETWSEVWPVRAEFLSSHLDSSTFRTSSSWKIISRDDFTWKQIICFCRLWERYETR